MSPVQVGVMAVREALIGEIVPHPVDLSGQSLAFQFEGSFETFPLETTRVFVFVSRKGALGRITQHDHELDRWQVAACPFERERMIKIVPTGLEGHHLAVRGSLPAGDFRDREMSSVPPYSAVIIQVEVVYSLVER